MSADCHKVTVVHSNPLQTNAHTKKGESFSSRSPLSLFKVPQVNTIAFVEEKATKAFNPKVTELVIQTPGNLLCGAWCLVPGAWCLRMRLCLGGRRLAVS